MTTTFTSRLERPVPTTNTKNQQHICTNYSLLIHASNQLVQPVRTHLRLPTGRMRWSCMCCVTTATAVPNPPLSWYHEKFPLSFDYGCGVVPVFPRCTSHCHCCLLRSNAIHSQVETNLNSTNKKTPPKQIFLHRPKTHDNTNEKKNDRLAAQQLSGHAGHGALVTFASVYYHT